MPLPLKKLLTYCYTFWVYCVFTVFMLLLLPFMLIPVIINRHWSWMTIEVIRLWAYIFSKLTFVRYKIHGKNLQQPNTAYVYVCNHNSFLDAPALPLALVGEFKALGKKELLNIPIFGWILRSVAVLVDRSDAASRKASVVRLNAVFKRGISIVVFPEGTTNKTDQPLTPFYDGAFRIAIENQAPIMPLVITNSRALMPREGFNNKPGVIGVHFLPPQNTEGLTMDDLPALKQKIFDMMWKALVDQSIAAGNKAQ